MERRKARILARKLADKKVTNADLGRTSGGMRYSVSKSTHRVTGDPGGTSADFHTDNLDL